MRSIRTFAAVLALAPLPAHLLAGPTNPPPGAIGPTYKTLIEVEPRIAISAANTPGDADSTFRITQPGSYYLTGTVFGSPGKSGIEIVVSGVTIDLNGFSLLGSTGSLYGITATGTRDSISIRNGAVIGWGISGIALGSSTTSCRVENVRATANNAQGIVVAVSSQVVDCQASGNGLTGIQCWTGSLIRGCSATENGSGGFYAGMGSAIESCTSSENTGNGFSLGNDCQITSCVATDNTEHGITTIDVCRIENCTTDYNHLSGIAVGYTCRVSRCSSFRNIQHGITFGGQCTIVDNAVKANGRDGGSGAGLHAHSGGTRSHIEGNNCSHNDWGIKIDGTLNLVINNTCSSNSTTNYEIVASNRVAMILTLGLSPAISGSSGGTAVTDPKANFAY